MARESISMIIIIALLSTLLVLSTRSGTIQNVFGKNNMVQMLGEGDPCSNQASQIDSLCQPEKSNIQSYDTTTREHYSNFGDTDARMDTFMNQYNKYQAEELGTSSSYQNDSVSNKGNTNSNESVTPTIVGHNGGGSPGGGGDNHNGGGSPGGGGDNHNGGGGPRGGGGNHNGGGSPGGGGDNHNGGGSPGGGGDNHNGGGNPGGGGDNHNGDGNQGGGRDKPNGGGSPGGGGDNHNGGGSPGGGGDNHNGGGSPGGGGDNQKGNNNQNNSPDGGGKSSTCTPVTLSDLPGQTKPLAICLISGQDTNIATEIGLGTFTLVPLNGDEYQLTITNLNGQTQPAIVTVALGATSPITIPGLGTGNVLI